MRVQHPISSTLTLQPPDLSGGPVSLVVPGGDSEDDGGLGGCVDVGGGQARVGDHALGARAAEHADEGELGRGRGNCLGVALGRGGGGLDSQVHAVLHDVPGAGAGRLPAEVGSVSGLGDFDSGWRPGEAGQTRLEGGDL